MAWPLAFFVAALALQPVATFELRGVVVDATGAPLAGARVSVGGGSAVTDERGRFSLEVDAPAPLVRVAADGFAEYVARADTSAPLRVTLQPTGLVEAVTVTASRSAGRLADTATATSVLHSSTLLTSAALTVDDALRVVPGFSLFRRSSSRVANPTTQGAGLRGLAPSGASRALVLADGVPLNDAFGGWVYWDRIPQAAVDRIEVVRGGSSAELYGNESIAGTIQIITLAPAAPIGRFSLEGGSHGAARLSGYGGTRAGRWRGFAAAERFVFDGYTIVAAEDRGPVDVEAGMRSWSALIDAGRQQERWWLAGRANWLAEARDNGTPLQRNDTTLRSFSARGGAAATGGAWTFTAFGGSTGYDQSFSAVNDSRTSERLTAVQRVTSDHQGASIAWAGAWGTRTVLAGGDARRASGASNTVGGSQTDFAGYAQVSWRSFDRLTATAGARAGAWSTADRTGTDAPRRRGYFMPRISAAWAAAPDLSVHVMWTRAGRTPTLNELYRPFQVGSVTTAANAQLGPETATTAEAGLLLERRPVSSRLVGFWTVVDDAVTNVTISASPARIARQRRNAGKVRARGLEAEVEWRPTGWSALAGGAAIFDSRFTESDEPGLAGKRIAQVPRWQTSLSLRLTRGRAVATLNWRATGAQYDDDRNRFVLRRANVLDLYLGANLGRVQPFTAIENLFDEEVDAGRTPVRTIGTPRTLRAGIRIVFP